MAIIQSRGRAAEGRKRIRAMEDVLRSPGDIAYMASNSIPVRLAAPTATKRYALTIVSGALSWTLATSTEFA